MIIDARRGPPALRTRYDLCIIGAGAAGISLALDCEPGPLRICLLEAGGLDYDKTAQELLSGEVSAEHYPPLRATRMAALGGTTGVWAGWCRPLEEFDFAGPSSRPENTWPLRRRELLPYYARAQEICGLGAFEYEADYWIRMLGDQGLLTDLPEFTNAVFHVNPQRFGRRYRRRLQESENVDLLLHAPVMRLCLNEAGRRVGGVEIHSPQGAATAIRATEFVLAAGGIENARLLLLSARSPRDAPGNGHGLVGRYFADHPFVDPGSLVFRESAGLVDFYLPRADPSVAGTSSVRGVLTPRPEILERERISNAALFFYPRYETHPAFETAEVKALLQFWAKLRHRAVPGGHWSEARRALRAPRRIVEAALRKTFIRNTPSKRWRLRAMFESEPRYDNRISLGSETDCFGRPRARIDWQLSERDLYSMSRVMGLFDTALQHAGIGYVERAFPDNPDAWRQAAEAGKHHLGTTRMHADPRYGVVDENCRIHEMENLHVAGSSVFTTPGYANPTLTIVALALRLADRIRQGTAS